MRQLHLSDRKYTILYDPDGNGTFPEVLRHGKPWPAMEGKVPTLNNLEYAMACRILELEDLVESFHAIARRVRELNEFEKRGQEMNEILAFIDSQNSDARP